MLCFVAIILPLALSSTLQAALLFACAARPTDGVAFVADERVTKLYHLGFAAAFACSLRLLIRRRG